MDTLQEKLNHFQLYLKKKGISKNTMISYTSAVRQYYHRYPEISVEGLQEHKLWLLSNYCSSTVNAKIYGINRYLHYLNSCGGSGEMQGSQTILMKDYHVPSVKRQQKPFLDNVISNQDYAALKKGLKTDGNLFWYFVVHFLGSTGARVSELVQVKVEHLRLGYMDLYSKGGKIRRIYFPQTLCEESLAWLSEQGITSGFLFLNREGKQISPRGVRGQLKQFAYRYGIDPATVYPHSFRHLYAKNFLAKFNDITLLADLLGHESIETTKIYLTQSSEEQKKVIDEIVVW